MARKSKKKKSLLQEIRETIHSLTKPKRISKKTIRRKAPPAKQLTHTTESAQALQENLELKITKKMSEELQKMKQQMQLELLEKLENQKNIHNDNNESVKKKNKETAASKKVKDKNKILTHSNKGRYKPQTHCTFLKVLILSDSVKGEVVVGYEVLDHSSQEVWGIGIHEGTQLGRSKLILNTKVKSRTMESKRQYYLANETDDSLYFSESYRKSVLLNGKLTVAHYTNGLADAIQQAYMAGYKSNSKIPKLRMS
ncbi:hypothetical protein [Paenibacillus sp. RC67]|uniref:hypothetical protein n=1 Tax=Paenibacillus sp. RC67 TaxID=3039392 RepID=UPI0024AE2EC9|nr:hypothetical protein [Paenibacillus sp. RC67]